MKGSSSSMRRPAWERHSVGNRENNGQADQDACLFSLTQRPYRWLCSVQEHHGSADRCARERRRLPEGNERSQSIVTERNIQVGENAEAWRENGRAHGPSLPLA